MVELSASELHSLMRTPDAIRIAAISAPLDFGKSTILDALNAQAGISIEEGSHEGGLEDLREKDRRQRTTMKSIGVHLYCELSDNRPATEKFYINLLDAPRGYSPYELDPGLLQVVDGALVVVDCVEGVLTGSNSQIRQLISHKIKPTLFLNKLDRLVLELDLNEEEIYENFTRIIAQVNESIGVLDSGAMGDVEIDPREGNCAFGSGRLQFGFSLEQFVKIYEQKLGVNNIAFLDRLWGDNYFDYETKTWINSNISASGKPLDRGFSTFILKPLKRLMKICMEEEFQILDKMLEKIGVNLDPSERELRGRHLTKAVLRKWLKLSDCVLPMIAMHLPSPRLAARYRTDILYEGPMDDPCAVSMRNCDPSGPLLLSICNSLGASDRSKFYSFGRVFSGTLAIGQKVRVMGVNYMRGRSEDLTMRKIEGIAVAMGSVERTVTSVPAGNLVRLLTTDDPLPRYSTISDFDLAYCIRSDHFLPFRPVVGIAVKPKHPPDLPKLITGLRDLTRFDSLVQTSVSESGEYIVSGCSDMHAEACVRDLEQYHACVALIKSQPIVEYKETVTQLGKVCAAVSTNERVRLECSAQPLDEELSNDIEWGRVRMNVDQGTLAQRLVGVYGWDTNDVANLWAFGPNEFSPNVLVDTTAGAADINEIKGLMQQTFQSVAREGVLCGENLRGVRINVVNASLHSDPVYRGSSQIAPVARRVFLASQLSAVPALLEPVYLVQIHSQVNCFSGVYECLSTHRGTILGEDSIPGTPLSILKCFLPVAESFGFSSALRSLSSGQAFPHIEFDHWQLVPGSALEPGSLANEVVQTIRKRKGLKQEIPQLEDYVDSQ